MKRVVLGLVLAALVVAGCSPPDPDPGDGSQSSPAASSSPQETTRTLADWAGEVCQARDLLELKVASVALGLDVDPGGGLDQLPELREQVEGEVEVLQQGVDDLLIAVRAVPDDSPEVSAFVDEVDTLVGSAQESANEALSQLQAATEADNALLAGVAAVQAVAAAQSAYSDATEALALLNDVRNDSSGPLARAFDDAPECA